MFLSQFKVSVLVLFFSFLAQAKIPFDAKYPLYSSEGKKYGFNQVHQALDETFSYGKPVVIYIHGRGDEPTKSVEGKTFITDSILSILEKDYDIRVLLFNWDAQGLLLDRKEPLSKIPAAAEAFKKVLDEVKTYDLLNKKLSLHAHSMGSIVIQAYIEKYDWTTTGSSIFTHVLLTEPDADNINHHIWMDKIAAKETLFLTINNDDVVLEKSTDARPKGASALGLKPSVSGLSAQAIYLDFTKLSDKINKATGVHQIYAKENMKNQVNVCRIIDQIFRSEMPNLKTGVLSSVNHSNYLKFKFELNPGHGCFK